MSRVKVQKLQSQHQRQSTGYSRIREAIKYIKEDYDLNPEAIDIILANDIEDAVIEKSKGM